MVRFVYEVKEQMAGLETLKKIYRNALSLKTRRRIALLRNRGKRQLRLVIGSLSASCRVCRGKNVLAFESSGTADLPFPLFICRDCHFIFVHPIPDLSNVYSYHEMPQFGLGQHIWNDHFLGAINKLSHAKKSLLEIGFGDGSFIRLAHEDGWNVHGLDVSPLFVEHAQHKLALPNIRQGTIEESDYPDESFDVIAAFNYIEHVPDPRNTLKHLRRILRADGLLVLLCPNLSGIYHSVAPEIFGGTEPLNISWVPPMHLSYFNKENFERLLESEGFKVIADESHLTSYLWLQHAAVLGPEVTNLKLQKLIAEIEEARKSNNDAALFECRERITDLLRQRMLWVMLQDLINLEPALGAENAVLYMSRKASQ